MDLFEHQAKELFAEYGVPVPTGKVARTPQEARAIAEELFSAGSKKVVVKAQVKTGGRGKAGGVKLADTADEAETLADRILGMDIKGHTVHKVLIEEGSAIAQEYYFSFLLDRANRTFLSICSVEGGVEIEEVPHDRLAMVPVSPLDGVDRATARSIAEQGRLPRRPRRRRRADRAAVGRVHRRGRLLVEVNPMILTADGQVKALDGKVTLDDNAGFRQDHEKFEDKAAADPLEAAAKAKDLNYVKLDGSVGIIGNGVAWSCPRWTSSPTRVSSSTARSRRTSSTSAAARPPR